MNARSFTAARTAARTMSFSSAVLKLLYVALENAQKTAKVLFNRRLARKLDEMSDRELADIGLTRDDVRFGISMPFNADPTVELARRARFNSGRRSI